LWDGQVSSELASSDLAVVLEECGHGFDDEGAKPPAEVKREEEAQRIWASDLALVVPQERPLTPNGVGGRFVCSSERVTRDRRR